MTMVRVVGIYGSPRKGGNSDTLLDYALQGAQKQGADVKRVYVRELHMSGCIECGGCENTGTCVLKDDMQDIYFLLDDAEVIIISSPIFFYGLSSQLKALIDRGQALWARRRLSQRSSEKNNYRGRGYLISIGATKGKGLFQGAQMVVRYFFDAINMRYEGGLFFQGIETMGAVKERPDTLQKAYNLGREVARN
jgi:multimeric flavodoxin WrbA